MNKVVVASLLAFATSTLAALPAVAQDQTTAAAPAQGASSGQITIKDPAEYNAYTNAIGQSSPAAKAQAIEAFLTQYPNSVVKQDMLEQLVGAYTQANDTPKTMDAARRLLVVDPSNMRALTYIVYVEKQQAQGDQGKLDDAASLAQKGLGSSKPAAMSDADYTKLKAVATPIFESAIAADDTGKKDYKGAIDAYQAELKAYTDPTQTQTGPGLLDTYLLGQAYLQVDPKDLVNAIWYLTRAAQFAPAQSKDQIEKTAEYWYNKYHGGMDGFDQVKTLAMANLMPPPDYKPVPAPPPPSPADLAHKAVEGTANLKTMALTDKEFVLANGSTEDAEKVWATMNGQTFAIPGKVVVATADSVQLAVSEDAQQSNKADFTINMKEPLKTVPTVGATVTYVATFDSYTQNPPMIVLKDGGPKAAAAPAHRATRR
ncbi:lipopolysaccharide assembly protein LapB [Acidipila sp. EB88]|uniref:tetratricopeptide repeat protein n=1 Tax=Acidipila sp. EB88 TaxID=2305226 RepID=UPI000F5EE704|nr:hypothetical protein [Acidipila sp. EB88]RRA47284.1 hypothetical protein D1Y84_02225 [Acidipila sp. EB88]